MVFNDFRINKLVNDLGETSPVRDNIADFPIAFD